MSRHGRVVAPQFVVAAAILAGLTAAIGPMASAPSAAAAVLVVANPDTLSVGHDQSATVAAPGVLENDMSVIGTTKAVLDVGSGPSHGTLKLNSKGDGASDPPHEAQEPHYGAWPRLAALCSVHGCARVSFWRTRAQWSDQANVGWAERVRDEAERRAMSGQRQHCHERSQHSRERRE